MWILSIYFRVLFTTVGFRYHSVTGFVLDPHLNSIWQRSSEMIHETARKQPCSNGRLPVLTGIQAYGDLYSYDLQCEDVQERDLERRTVTMCSTTCTEVCYHPADYNPDPKDCSNATQLLVNMNGNWDVPVGGTKVYHYQTCQFTFVNQGHDTINFCDSALGNIGNMIAWDCGRWLADPAKGGICTNNDFYVTYVDTPHACHSFADVDLAVRTPNMPGPSYTVQFSTIGDTELGGGASTAVSATASLSSGSVSGAASQQTISNVTSGATQTLPGTPVVTFVDGQATGDVSIVGISPQASVGPSPLSNKVDTAAAVGGTIAGVAFLALVIAGIFLYRRMERRDALADKQAALLVSSMNQAHPDSLGPFAAVYRIPEKRPRSIPAASSIASHAETGSPLDNTDTTSSFASQDPEYVYPRPHPRSTEALIAAAAPPNMSRDQIDLLAANFVSLVRGRHPREDVTEDGDVSELPPYHHA